MTGGDRRAAYRKGGLYRRYVYEKDESGQPVRDRRGNPIVSYEYWQATYEIPSEDLPDGVRRRRITGNAASKTAALAALRENIDAFYKRKRDGEPTYRVPRTRGAKRRTVDDLFTNWLEMKNVEDMSMTVLRKYRRLYEMHIQPHIGHEYLDRISSAQLMQLLNSTLVSKKKTDQRGRPIPGTRLLGAAARANVWRVLRMCFRWGERSNYFAGRANPMLLVRKPKSEPRTIDIDARIRDSDRVMTYVEEHRPELLCLLGLQLLGLRQMERLGLRVEDVLGIEGDNPRLSVNGQLARFETDEVTANGDGRRWYRKPLTKTGKPRVIPLREPFLTHVRDHLERREANTKNEGYKDWKDDPIGGLLFQTERGSVITKTTDNEIWREVCIAAGVEPFPQHLNRYITAAKLAELKPAVPGNVVRAILGHESEAIGAYYQRITAENSDDALTRYGKSYRKQKGRTKAN